MRSSASELRHDGMWWRRSGAPRRRYAAGCRSYGPSLRRSGMELRRYAHELRRSLRPLRRSKTSGRCSEPDRRRSREGWRVSNPSLSVSRMCCCVSSARFHAFHPVRCVSNEALASRADAPASQKLAFTARQRAVPSTPGTAHPALPTVRALRCGSRLRHLDLPVPASLPGQFDLLSALPEPEAR